jgi:diguanylate cyclase (GGDEF)-like protein
VGIRLSATLRNIDCLARLGGDEFVILLGNINGAEDAELLARKIMAEFSHPFELKNHRLHVTASIGISVYPDNAEDAAGLLKRADISMYRSKAGCATPSPTTSFTWCISHRFALVTTRFAVSRR